MHGERRGRRRSQEFLRNKACHCWTSHNFVLSANGVEGGGFRGGALDAMTQHWRGSPHPSPRWVPRSVACSDVVNLRVAPTLKDLTSTARRAAAFRRRNAALMKIAHKYVNSPAHHPGFGRPEGGRAGGWVALPEARHPWLNPLPWPVCDVEPSRASICWTHSRLGGSFSFDKIKHRSHERKPEGECQQIPNRCSPGSFARGR